ncbi:hypothetical protein TTHERM_00812670 (macronuclear) [Tetrahymena thermophila SB210]|uniref:Uncharacterized protein n=1 Tax=Tetrahymena thermophila (strain SB210) TaxID=312017 RepID=Q22SW4_TETTS|nr:hypothetical protein TTHERM_00812670 [Tetrahymena thermophila SB210]EAR88350.2 hypothetical protein TTHERM_00812670 [Tetrahymena thermophila SB210]|eukprot:XP_001008595.2 hypothetical protein TTHERM_00812670 [Tetrahymena thermophila SB210]
MDNCQNEIAKLIENYQFSIPFSNKTEHMDYPTVRKSLEEQGCLRNLVGAASGYSAAFQNEQINPYQFEIIQNKDNFFVKGGTQKWHKNIVIPQMQVKLLESNNSPNPKQLNGAFEIEMKCWAKKENGQFIEIQLENNSGAKKIGNNNLNTNSVNSITHNNNISTCGKTINTLQNLDKIVKFSSLKFSSTGYLESEIAKSPSGQNNQNPENIIKFRIYIYIYKLTAQNTRQIYDIYFSHPITVSARKKSRQSRASFSVLMEPFLPKYLDTVANDGHQGIVDLKDFLSKASERHKIFHPLYLFGRFPSALNIYYKCSLKRQKAEKLGKDQIISFQETLIEAFMQQEEQVVILHFNTDGLEKEQIRKVESYLKPLKNKQVKLCFSEQELNRLKKDNSYVCLQKEGFIDNYKRAYYELTKVLLNIRNKLQKVESFFVLRHESNITKFEEIQKKSIKQVFEFNRQSSSIQVTSIKALVNNVYSHNDQDLSVKNAKSNADYNILSQSASPQKIMKTSTKNDSINNNKSSISFDSNILANIETEQNIKFEKKARSPLKQTQPLPCFSISENRSEFQDSVSNQIQNCQFQQPERNIFTQQPEINQINHNTFNQYDLNNQLLYNIQGTLDNSSYMSRYQEQSFLNQDANLRQTQSIFKNIDIINYLKLLIIDNQLNCNINQNFQPLQQQLQQPQQQFQQFNQNNSSNYQINSYDNFLNILQQF